MKKTVRCVLFGASACVIFILYQKIQKMVNVIWVSPCGRPHMPTQTEGGETQPERSTTLCGMAGDFGLVPGMLTYWQVEQVK